MRYRLLRREDEDGKFYATVAFYEEGGQVHSAQRSYIELRPHPGVTLEGLEAVPLEQLGIRYVVPYRFGPIQETATPDYPLDLLSGQPVED